MSEILLTTLNAKYAHCAFGLRYLMANLGPLKNSARILEFDIGRRPLDVAESILAHHPRIVGMGVYIWNTRESAEVAALIKKLAPQVTIVLGGPEVSHEQDQQEIVRWADYVITNEADQSFAQLCQKLIAGDRPLQKIIAGELPKMEELALPYDLYTDEDIAQRVVYVEASRGCPFRCEFCLSSLDVPVRNVPLENFLASMQRLLDRGLRQFKFVDRTFNLNVNIGKAILTFFLERWEPGLFIHFEMIPDRLPEALREIIAKFPPGALQFEVGIQTFNPKVMELISRKQDEPRVADNLAFLREHTGVHVHADLIVGLPGEDIDSFAAGLDQLITMGPQEVQIGILKRLRGTPIARHSDEWEMVYSPYPPYEVLKTSLVDFETMQRMRRFARFWDMIVNSGNFVRTTPLIWQGASPFWSFMQLSDWLFAHAGQTHAIALPRLTQYLHAFFEQQGERDMQQVSRALAADYAQGGRRDLPVFLRDYADAVDKADLPQKAGAPARQQRHLSIHKTSGHPSDL